MFLAYKKLCGFDFMCILYILSECFGYLKISIRYLVQLKAFI